MKMRTIALYKIGRYQYVYVDGVYLRHNWGREFENAAIWIVIIVNVDGYCDVLRCYQEHKKGQDWFS